MMGRFLFDRIGGQLLAWVAGVGVLLALWQIDRAVQRSVGRQEIVKTVEGTNAKVAAKAGRAGFKSRDPDARGVLNPYYRTD